jgi:hypothetical protein
MERNFLCLTIMSIRKFQVQKQREIAKGAYVML